LAVFLPGCPALKIENSPSSELKNTSSATEQGVVDPTETESEKEPETDNPPEQITEEKNQDSYKVTFHEKSSAIFNNYVDDSGLVDYMTLRRMRLELSGILNQYAELPLTEYLKWPENDQTAFWINAYNLHVINIMMQNYPVDAPMILKMIWGPDSTRHIDKKIGGIDNQKFIIMNEEFTLNEINQRFFLEEFMDYRVCFALSRGNLSSPPLRNEPYTGEKLDEQLNDQIDRFLARDTALKIDRNNNAVFLSIIFSSDWYGEKFLAEFSTDRMFKDHSPVSRAVLNFLTQYIPQHEAAYLKTGTYTVNYLNYNWEINDQ
jgi:hypothetical protein